MVAVLAMVIVLLVAYIGSTWATIANLRERNAELQAVLERRGGAWHEVPTTALPKAWDDDVPHEDTIPCIAPPMVNDDVTERRVMIL